MARVSSPIVTDTDVERYLDCLRAQGTAEDTIRTYRRCLTMFLKSFSEDPIPADALICLQEQLTEEGYSASTVNVNLSAAANFLSFLGISEVERPARLQERHRLQPEISRQEYLRLLHAACHQGKERTYLIIRVFVLTGLPVQLLNQVTAKAVEQGWISVQENGKRRRLRFPAVLQNELLSFAVRQGIANGPLFVTRDGKPMARTSVTGSIRRLCAEAQVAPEKGNPKCLRRLYQETIEMIRTNLALLEEQTYNRLLEDEQFETGWQTQ